MECIAISALAACIVLAVFLPLDKLQNMKRFHKHVLTMDGSKGDRDKYNYSSGAMGQFLLMCSRLYNVLKIKHGTEVLQKYNEKVALVGLGKREGKALLHVQAESIFGAKYFLSICGLVAGLLLAASTKDALTVILSISVMALTGFIMPDLILKDKITKRKWKIETELPYVLNTLSIMAEAGASLNEAIARVCRVKEGVLADELKLVNDEIDVGILQKEALLNMSKRCQVNEVTRFVFALVQSIEKGSSGISGILKEQACEAWEKRKNRAKELGEKASMKLFLPMMLLVFPCLLIFLAGPAIVAVMKMFG